MPVETSRLANPAAPVPTAPPGRLTPVRAEVRWFAFFPALAAIAGVAGVATRGPTLAQLLTMLAVALVPWTAFIVWLVAIRDRFRHTFHGPLADEPRASARWAALHGALPLGGFTPALPDRCGDARFRSPSRADEPPFCTRSTNWCSGGIAPKGLPASGVLR